MALPFSFGTFLESFWLEQVGVPLGHFWGPPLFFDKVHYIALTFHTFVSLHCLCSLHSRTLSKRGIFVDPQVLFLGGVFSFVRYLESHIGK